MMISQWGIYRRIDMKSESFALEREVQHVVIRRIFYGFALPETFGSRCTSPLVPFTFRKLDKTQVFRWKIHQDYHKTTISSKIAPALPLFLQLAEATSPFQEHHCSCSAVAAVAFILCKSRCFQSNEFHYQQRRKQSEK